MQLKWSGNSDKVTSFLKPLPLNSLPTLTTKHCHRLSSRQIHTCTCTKPTTINHTCYQFYLLCVCKKRLHSNNTRGGQAMYCATSVEPNAGAVRRWLGISTKPRHAQRSVRAGDLRLIVVAPHAKMRLQPIGCWSNVEASQCHRRPLVTRRACKPDGAGVPPWLGHGGSAMTPLRWRKLTCRHSEPELRCACGSDRVREESKGK